METLQVGQGSNQHLVRDASCFHPRLEPLAELLAGVNVGAELPYLIGVLRHVLTEDIQGSGHCDQFGERAVIARVGPGKTVS